MLTAVTLGGAYDAGRVTWFVAMGGRLQRRRLFRRRNVS